MMTREDRIKGIVDALSVRKKKKASGMGQEIPPTDEKDNDEGLPEETGDEGEMIEAPQLDEGAPEEGLSMSEDDEMPEELPNDEGIEEEPEEEEQPKHLFGHKPHTVQIMIALGKQRKGMRA